MSHSMNDPARPIAPICYIFDNVGISTPKATALPGPDYAVDVFQPSLSRIKPKALPRWPFLGYWLLHTFRVFRTRSYRIFLARRGDEVVHYTVVIPKYFRFPFMSKDDLHIGPTWTHPDHRGRSLARAVLGEILRAYPDRRCWYLAREANVASRSVAEGAGLRLIGQGRRFKRFGLRALGSFRIMTSSEPPRTGLFKVPQSFDPPAAIPG